jgi:hypothetical protein
MTNRKRYVPLRRPVFGLWVVVDTSREPDKDGAYPIAEMCDTRREARDVARRMNEEPVDA